MIDSLWLEGISVFLATPSGARPAWMSQAYPEVLRVGRDRIPALHGGRHNHCMTSPVYRQKVQAINSRLAARYAHHPAVIGWHVSNEYGGSVTATAVSRPFAAGCSAAMRRWII